MNKTIGKQIWIIMFISFGFLSAITFGGIYSLNKISQLTHKLYDHPYTVSNAVRDIKIGILSINKAIEEFAKSESQQRHQELIKLVKKQEELIQKEIETVKVAFLGDVKKVEELESNLHHWNSIKKKIFDHSLNNKNNNKAAALLIENENEKQVKMIMSQTNWLLEFANKKGKDFILNTDILQKNTLKSFIIGSILGLFLLIVIVFFTIKRIKNGLCQVSRGISTQSNSINTNVVQLSRVGKDLLDASQKQSSFLSSTVEAVTELEATAFNTSEKSKKASSIANENKDIAEKGKESLRNLTDAIVEIQKSNKDVVTTVTKNNDDVGNIANMIQEISDKTQIINDIVFQTKLLSFNASVEAARAGEHGKGFSVVAEEIGSLANLSGVAATEINQMLEVRTAEIQNLVKNASKTISSLVKSTKEKVQKGIDLSGECQASFNSVTKNANNINILISEVENMTTEQLAAIKLVQKDVSELNRLGQKYQDSSQETHSTSTELLEGQKDLDNVVIVLHRMVSSDVG